MTEGKRQKQVAAVINQELNDIFLRMGFNMSDGGMISISSVKVTPDLFEARIYLSFFHVKDNEAMLSKINEKNKEIRKELGTRVRHQLRSIPELTFYIDDTLDYVFKIEELLKKVKTGDNENESTKTLGPEQS
jgi:ribosome-binding factor A